MAPKTVKETLKMLISIVERDTNTEIIYGKVADILADICTESLNPLKPTGGKVGYAGSPLIDEWEYKENAYPFHIKDNITQRMVPDPRVVLIGKFIYQIGVDNFGDGMPDMQTVYQKTGQRIHTYVSPLSAAWHGIGWWQN